MTRLAAILATGVCWLFAIAIAFETAPLWMLLLGAGILAPLMRRPHQ